MCVWSIWQLLHKQVLAEKALLSSTTPTPTFYGAMVHIGSLAGGKEMNKHTSETG